VDYEGLLNACELSAEERIKDLMGKTFSKVTEIKNEASEQSKAVIACHIQNMHEKIFILRNARLFKAREEVKSRILNEKENYFTKAFEIAGNRLKDIRNNKEYPELLSGLLFESLSSGPGPFIVHIDPRDESLLKSLITNDPKIIQVVADIETSGGVILTTEDSSITFSNTFETRLEKAKMVLKEEIYKKLSE